MIQYMSVYLARIQKNGVGLEDLKPTHHLSKFEPGPTKSMNV
jgi:hypothetical protein